MREDLKQCILGFMGDYGYEVKDDGNVLNVRIYSWFTKEDIIEIVKELDGEYGRFIKIKTRMDRTIDIILAESDVLDFFV